jgi:hypothetical protein
MTNDNVPLLLLLLLLLLTGRAFLERNRRPLCSDSFRTTIECWNVCKCLPQLLFPV